MKLLRALLLAPLAALPAMAVAALARGWSLDGSHAMFFVVHQSFAYAAALVFGLPLHLLLRRAGRGAPWLYGVLGCAIGAGVAASAITRTTLLPVDWIGAVLAGGAGGGIFRALVGAVPAREKAAR